MSEVASRGSAPRGRGSYRGGRGGHSARGGRGGNRQTVADKLTATETGPEEQGEIGELKRKYASSVKIVQEMFPHYSSEDIVFAIEENGGDLEQTINKMSEGNVQQWEVTKKEKTKAPKAKDTLGEDAFGPIRGSRGRGGAESARGGRGRATERGRGAGRGARGGSTVNVAKGAKSNETPTPVTAAETPAATTVEAPVDLSASTEDATAGSPSTSWEVVTPSEVPPPGAETTKSGTKPDGTRTWASMLKPAAKPKPAPAAKPVTPAVPQVQEQPVPVAELESAPEPVIATPPAPVTPLVEPSEQMAPSAPPSLPPSEPSVTPVAPSEDKLTEENLELVKDTSHPVVSETVASTIGTEEPRSAVGTPLHGPVATPVRPGLGGFATSALKATQGSSRASSFRRVKDQQEAVVMPSNHAVDRTAVQFGSLGLSGSEDVDDDREEAETRAQPPQHSPIAPRASLPIAPQQPVSESAPTPRAAPGLSSELPQVTQSETAPAAQSQQQYDQFSNRFGGLPGSQAPGSTSVSKPYEPFGQQLAGTSHHPFDNYASQSQAPGQQGQTAPSNLGGFGSGYDNYYQDYQRNAHAYGGFGQQQGQGAQETGAVQRGAGAFGSSAADPASQYATSHTTHNRFGGAGDALNSGHSTPAPGAGQPTLAQSQAHGQSHHHGSHGQASNAPYTGYGQYGGQQNNNPFSYMGAPNQHQATGQQYGRDRPAFDDARRYEEQYMSGQQSHYGYAGYNAYGNGPYSGGKYAQPYQYGTSYDGHSASQANSFGREHAGGNYGYARTGSAQPESSQQGQHSSSAYGSMNDPFSRSGSGFPGQSSTQQSQGISADEGSRYGADSGKIATGGPSPAPTQQRPDSTTNTSQSGPQQGQQAYNNYPHNLGGFGSGHQGGHQGTYGGFGGNAGYGNYSYGSNNRGQWAGYGGGH